MNNRLNIRRQTAFQIQKRLNLTRYLIQAMAIKLQKGFNNSSHGHKTSNLRLQHVLNLHSFPRTLVEHKTLNSGTKSWRYQATELSVNCTSLRKWLRTVDSKPPLHYPHKTSKSSPKLPGSYKLQTWEGLPKALKRQHRGTEIEENCYRNTNIPPLCTQRSSWRRNDIIKNTKQSTNVEPQL